MTLNDDEKDIVQEKDPADQIERLQHWFLQVEGRAKLSAMVGETEKAMHTLLYGALAMDDLSPILLNQVDEVQLCADYRAILLSR